MPLYREEPVAGERGTRSTDDVCERLGPDRFRIDGRELRVPLRIDDCAIVANVFWVDAVAAQALIGDDRLAIAEPMKGRTLLVLLGVQYRDNPLGNYGEGAILFPVRSDGQKTRLPLGGLFSMLSGSAAQLVYRMPVDQEFTTHAGRFMWGYPKYLATLEVALGDDLARTDLYQDGQLVFALQAPASRGRAGRLFETKGHTLTVRSHVVRHIGASGGGVGVAWRLGGPPPRIGDAHPLALELRSLGLPKAPFVSGSIRHAHLSLSAAREVRDLGAAAGR